MRLNKYILLIFCIFSLSAMAGVKPFHWPQSDWTHLNVGIYWVTKHNQYCAANAPCAKRVFNPSKPTLIFIHGWEPESTRFRKRFTFLVNKSQYTGGPWFVAKPWLDKGWNVGVFEWNQLSDTDFPSQAIAKVWSTHTSQGMYWTKLVPATANHGTSIVEVNVCSANSHNHYCQPVSNTLFQDYIQAMKGYKGNDIRILGHSVGAQLAVLLTHHIADQAAEGKLAPNLIPRQLVLLDPFFSSDNSYLNDIGIYPRRTAGEYVKQIADNDGIAVSEYLSSNLTLPDEWGPIEKTAALIYYRPWYEPFYDPALKHSASWETYLESMQDKPPVAYVRNDIYSKNDSLKKLNIPALSASTPLLHLNKESGVALLMGANTYLDQKCTDTGKLCGEYSFNPKNDGFLVKSNEVSAEPQVTRLVIKKQGSFVDPGEVLHMQPGQTMRLMATAMPLDANNRIVIWQSNNSTIVHTYPGGYLSASQPGMTTVTAVTPIFSAGGMQSTIERNIKIDVS